MDLCHSRKIYPTNTGKNYWRLLQKKGLNVTKTTSKKVFHITAETTGELIVNKIADKIM